MRVLVTGGTGLVGSHVVERLVRRGDSVVALVRRSEGRALVEWLGAESALGTVEESESWTQVGEVDAVVHAAAIVAESVPWERYHAVNVLGTRHAVDTAARSGARLVHISSIAVYGRRTETAKRGPLTEDAPFTPIAEADYYARSKRLAEEILWERARELGVSAAALRPCVIYGERERIFVTRVMRVVRFGVAPLVGKGDNHLAVVFAGNVAEAVIAALDRPDVEGAFNTTNDGGITQRQFFEIIGAAEGRRMRFVRLPLSVALVAGHAWHLWRRLRAPGSYAGIGGSGARFLSRDNPFSSEKAERELGWQPTTAPHEALAQTVRWFRSGGGD